MTLSNDGNIVKDPHKADKGVPPAYDAKYYDCWYPYKKSYEEIGGYSKGGLYNGEGMPVSRRKEKVSSTYAVTEQGFYNSVLNFGSVGEKVSPEGVEIAVDSKGNEYLIAAVHGFTVGITDRNGADKPAKFAYFGWYGSQTHHDGGIRGSAFDVILTDGTVLHFIVGDVQANCHAMGYMDGAGMIAVTEGLSTDNAKLNYTQYRYGWGAQPGHNLELYCHTGQGVADNFRKKYLKNASVAYIRMYNFYADTGKERKNGYTKSYEDHFDGVTITGSGKDEEFKKDNKNDDSSVGVSWIKEEKDLHGMPDISKMSDDQNVVDIPTGLDNVSDQINANSIKENMKARQREVVRYWTNVFVTALGLMLLVYTVLLVVAWLTDRVNNIFDFSLITLITFGVVKPTREEAKEGSTISLPRLIMICSATFLGAIFLISGGVFDVVQYILNWITGLF